MSEKRIDVVVSTGKSRPEVEALDDSMRDLGASADKVSGSADRASTSIHKMKPAAEAVNKSIGGLGRNAGMAGIQVQQFVGQIQGGQSAMLALSQQSADLGFVLGAPLLGAVVGITASFASFLLPMLRDSKEETEDLTDALRQLASQESLTAKEAAILSEAEGRVVAKNLNKKRALLEEIADAEALARRQRGAIATAGTDQEEIERYSKGLEETEANLSKLRVAFVVTNKEIEKGTRNIISYNENINKPKGGAIDGQLIAIQQSIALETELYEAARVQRLATEAGFQTEDQERVRVAEAQKLIVLQEQHEQKRALLIANNESTEALELLHQQKVTKITQDSDRARLKLSNAAEKQQLAASKQVFEQQLSSAAQSSRAMFNVNKAYQASKAAMQIPAIAQNSYEYGSAIGGPPLGAAFAAIGVAAGLSNLRAITSAKFGDASSTNTAGVPGTPGVVNSPFANNQQAPQAPTQQRFVDIRLDDNALLTGSAVKDIISNLLGSDEDVTMQITANQNELKRIGAI